MNYETKVDLEGEAVPELETEADTGRKRRVWIIAAVMLALVVAAFFMLSSGSDEAVLDAEADTTPAVTVVSPGRGTIEGIINATGTLAARRAMPVGVVGEGGRVVSVPVEQGEWVRAGQILAVIDRSVQNEQARSSSAQIEVARADARLAQSNLDRAQQLVERGFISQADIDRLTATRDAAAARVNVAEAQYRELLARNNRLNIVAPAAGLLLERNVEPGQVVGAGASALFTIAKDGEMEMRAALGETELASLSVGVPATVIPVGTDKQFTGQVWQIAPTIDQQNRQGMARIALAYAPELRPGGFASAQIESGTVVAPMLPESAILSDDNGSYVYIVDGDNNVVRQPVELGLVTDDGIAIANGLSGSESVVLRAGGFLTEGETVRPVTAEGAS